MPLSLERSNGPLVVIHSVPGLQGPLLEPSPVRGQTASTTPLRLYINLRSSPYLPYPHIQYTMAPTSGRAYVIINKKSGTALDLSGVDQTSIIGFTAKRSDNQKVRSTYHDPSIVHRINR